MICKIITNKYLLENNSNYINIFDFLKIKVHHILSQFKFILKSKSLKNN